MVVFYDKYSFVFALNEYPDKKIEMIYGVKKGWYIYEYEDNKKEYMYIIIS